MKAAEIDTKQRIYSLRHIESAQEICLLQDGIDYLACFTNPDDALEFRGDLGLQEHVDLHVSTISGSTFKHFWLDGKNVEITK
jgi:hypothetical protein